MKILAHNHNDNCGFIDQYTQRRLHPLAAAMLLVFCTLQVAQANDSIQFNTDVLDVKDRSRIDLQQFSREGYLMPGNYQLMLRVNKSETPEQTVTYMAPDNDPKGSQACLTPKMVDLLGLKDERRRHLTWWHHQQCMELSSLPGMTARADLGTGTLYLSVPQAYLEYTSDNWDPPSLWDNGVPGVLFDYNMNAMNTRESSGGQVQNISGNGTTGANYGPWRLRADWQSQYSHTTGQRDSTQQNWDWSRYYAYRAITSLKAKLQLGETYLNSGMFDSFRFTGASLSTDDSQLPPNLRGYAPEVAGVAKTNAKVTVSQQGRVLYETTVPAGPFRIQDLSEAVSGKLDVRIQEQDGTVQTFQIDTASIPYLTRPGLVRYKVSAGKTSDYGHHLLGPDFTTGEFSWGVNNGWSLYGGGIFAGSYNALALGIGRDLLALGALSLDVTQSRANGLPHQGVKDGGSYRLSYSKRFDKYDSQVTFAGYRFADRNFMSMSQYLAARYHNTTNIGSGKELYTVTLNKQFRALNMSTYLNYSHHTYWNRQPSDTWNATVSDYFDMGRWKNVSLTFSAYRSQIDGVKDDGMYLSLSIPWGANGSLSYNGQFGGSNSNSIRYSGRTDSNDNYSLTAGETSDGRGTGSGYFTHNGDLAEMTANASFRGSKYSALGLSLQGGMTATEHGVALHRNSVGGGTRMMVDTDGVSGVPVRGDSGVTDTNLFGKTVVGDVSSYFRSSVNVDLNTLPDDIEATRSVVTDTLTEGAIGYRSFGILSGRKGMAVIKLPDGTVPPFGSTVTNLKQIQTGIIGDDGNVWLSGMQPDGEMLVKWGSEKECRIHLPGSLPAHLPPALLLPCTSVTGDKALVTKSTDNISRTKVLQSQYIHTPTLTDQTDTDLRTNTEG